VGKHKKIVKELKRPDQFVDFWTRASHTIATVVAPRRKPAIAVVVALAVVLVGAAIFNVWDQSRRLTASRKLARIQQIANAELLPAASGAKEAEAADAKDESKDGIARFKTIAERQTEVLKELDSFLATHAGAGLRAEALIMKGAALLGVGKNDEAIAAYQLALDGHLDARLRFLAHEGQGYAYEAKGDLDKAVAAFGQIAGDATQFHGFYQDRALYHKARLVEIKGDKSGAVTIYRQILDKVPDTSMKDEIMDRLSVLESK
jgi:tetratricopeptide (TPR) repeat protein